MWSEGPLSSIYLALLFGMEKVPHDAASFTIQSSEQEWLFPHLSVRLRLETKIDFCFLTVTQDVGAKMQKKRGFWETITVTVELTSTICCLKCFGGLDKLLLVYFNRVCFKSTIFHFCAFV